MKAIILAAGKGTRMLPLTKHTPKALLEVNNKPLIVHHIENLKSSGITEIVINIHHLGDFIKGYLKDGKGFGVKISYSEEDELLNTGGGILKALPLLGKEPFIYVAADIFTDFDFSKLIKKSLSNPDLLSHLILVKNPEFNKKGDFDLDSSSFVTVGGNTPYTFASIGLLKPDIFQGVNQEKFPLVDILHLGIAKKQITGEIFSGIWHNVGTPQQLSVVDTYNKANS